MSESELSFHYLVYLLVRLDYNRTLRHKTHQDPKGALIIIPFTKMESLKIQINRGLSKEKNISLVKDDRQKQTSHTQKECPLEQVSVPIPL